MEDLTEIEITILKSDIEDPTCRYDSVVDCPIARALQRAVGGLIVVGERSVGHVNREQTIQMPDELPITVRRMCSYVQSDIISQTWASKDHLPIKPEDFTFKILIPISWTSN